MRRALNWLTWLALIFGAIIVFTIDAPLTSQIVFIGGLLLAVISRFGKDAIPWLPFEESDNLYLVALTIVFLGGLMMDRSIGW